jgi:hypothetical protein
VVSDETPSADMLPPLGRSGWNLCHRNRVVI